MHAAYVKKKKGFDDSAFDLMGKVNGSGCREIIKKSVVKKQSYPLNEQC
jgi:hypothetical protein